MESRAKEAVTKQGQWERKLLDLSMRNMLINMRMTKAVVPLLSSDISVLEDALAEGEEFRVLPRPEEMEFAENEKDMVERLGDLGALAEYIVLEGRRRRLHSLYGEKELSSCLTKLYRSARTSLEENGASTLYLAAGLLRWYETKKSTTVRYAPIVLIPVEIQRKSAGKGYALFMRDEDAQINVTLLEFLKQNYDLEIRGLNPPPTDEHGLDIPGIFAIVREALTDFPMWSVAEAGVIGNFSFSQFAMWKDIRSQSGFLEKNKIVRSLIQGAVDWDCRVPEDVDAGEAYLPVTVDASQRKAIHMAAEGISFVLHGPPGTGKSQTITAMIANALTKGKTVLFVAEKMAALEVVQKRLEALGIRDFCLELHSNKATKKMVLDQLKRGLELIAEGEETDYHEKIRDIRRMREDLDAYGRALHRSRDFGKSLRQLIDLYETIPEQETKIRFDPAFASGLSEDDLNRQMQALERLGAAGRAVGHPHGHPLSAVHQTEYSQSLKFDLESMIREWQSALEALGEALQVFRQQVGEQGWKETVEYARALAAAGEIPAFLQEEASLEKEFARAEIYMECRAGHLKKTAALKEKWNENFLRMDMEGFRRKYDQANQKFFGKGKALKALTSELQAYAGFSVETDRIPVYLTDVSFYQKEEAELSGMEEALPYEWKEILSSCRDPESLGIYKEQIKEQLRIIGRYQDAIREMDRETFSGTVDPAKKFLKALETEERWEKEASRLLELDFKDGGENWMEARAELCRCILEHASDMKSWIIYREIREECVARGLAPVCAAYESGLSHETLIPVYLRSVYQAMIQAVIESEPVLNRFTGAEFHERIRQFKKLDQEFMELTKEEMYYRLTHQLPSPADSVEVSKELNILRRAISSNGRGVSVRSLFEQIPHVLSRLCPCMLMSPISVAQYLAAENDLFDIVIFDEASQLPTCKAVGVLARGENAVIVGDPNQMPPTSFFAGNTVDEDNLELEDLDSILDDCLALGMPQAHLHWHYRSRHESLIAFSNQEFYENSMLTFPSVNDREKRVRMVKAEGYFDRGKGRVNRGEAEMIVREVRQRYEDPERRNQTVGVVTFNMTQQTLIEDLLQEEYQKDAAFDMWAHTGEEPLFVKNLENVQGDERDVILFSVAFGPDAEGKLTLNFGPLNKAGGWKRLNVAVSRARSEMVVFTVMTPDMIDLKRTKARGVEALKDFLEFADKGRLREDQAETRTPKDQGILEHICRSLSDAGYRYQTAVGHSRFKVDVAVIDPNHEEEYLMGILLDGEAYARSADTKDREIAQTAVLQGLGWRLHRVWTMDWWDNREKELDKLLQLLAEAEKAAGA